MKNFLQDLKDYWFKIIEHFPQFFSAIVLFFIFLFTTYFIKLLIKRLANKIRDRSNKEVFLFLGRVFQSLIIIIGVISALAMAGVNLAALLTGAGIFGFVFGFTLRDLISNFLAGVILLFKKPLKIGDFIEVDGKYGRVLSIDLHYTILLQNDNRKIIIPNFELLTKIIICGKRNKKVE